MSVVVEGGGGRKVRRQHGFQPPLHPLQVSGWLGLVGLSSAAFTVLVPALPDGLQPHALAGLVCLLLAHLVAHSSAAIVDPAERALRRLRPGPVPPLDRTKHSRVIEGGFCNLCRIEVSDSRTKHCSSCNKCVAGFDHHCKWLNHCVGSRNYVQFLMCVSTAIAAAGFVAFLAFAELAVREFDLDKTDNSSVNRPSSLPSGDATFIAIATIVGVLAIVTTGLLLHLCFFHIYISFLGLTTYEYIRQQRHEQAAVAPEPTTDRLESRSHLHRRPADLSCDNRSSRRTFIACAVLEETFTGCAEPTPTPPTTPQDCQVCVVPKNTVSPEGSRTKKSKNRWNCCAAVPDSPDDRQSPTGNRCLISLCRRKAVTKYPTLNGRPHTRPHTRWSREKFRVLFRVLSNLGINRTRNSHPSSNCSINKTNQQSTEEQPSEIQTIDGLLSVPPTPLIGRQRRRTIGERELANALAALEQQQLRSTPPQYKRRKRGAVHRPTKTPALSPIRESGLSNPASPSRQSSSVNSISGACTRPF